MIVTATIAVPSSSAAAALIGALAARLGSASTASTALGITLESKPTMRERPAAFGGLGAAEAGVWSAAAAPCDAGGLRLARPAARTARQRGHAAEGETFPPLAPSHSHSHSGAAGKKRARPADCGCGPPPLQRSHSSGPTAAAPADVADLADLAELAAGELECADEGAEAGAAAGAAGAAGPAGAEGAEGAAGALRAAPKRPRSPPPQRVQLRLRGVRVTPRDERGHVTSSWRAGEALSGVRGFERWALHCSELLPRPGRFQPGDAVVVDGLLSRPALNGRAARVDGLNAATGRYASST